MATNDYEQEDTANHQECFRHPPPVLAGSSLVKRLANITAKKFMVFSIPLPPYSTPLHIVVLLVLLCSGLLHIHICHSHDGGQMVQLVLNI